MKLLLLFTFLIPFVNSTSIWAAKDNRNFKLNNQHFISVHQKPYFDIPVTYNKNVKYWLNFFQSRGKRGFQIWLNRSHRYIPRMKAVLKVQGLPMDLAYIAMIESGFSAHAISSAQAVGYWQFISSTGKRYGLKKDWWIDERKDFYRSTKAASKYLSDLYKLFNSWYLTAAAYNMGETRLKRLIKRHKTRNFWKLSRQKGFPQETKDYIPKLIAAVLIAKNPKLYGFKKTRPHKPYKYEPFYAPGGTHLSRLAQNIGFTSEHLRALNPALIYGFIPKSTNGYWIRIPKGHLPNVARYIRKKTKARM